MLQRGRMVRLASVARRLIGICAVGCALSCAACASMFEALPAQMGGLPAGTPERTQTTAAYPAVHDMPPQRGTVPMTDADRQAAEADMVAARERQVQEATPSTPVSTKTKRRKDPGT